MKSRTKLWLVMLISAASSLILFLLLSFIVSKIWNDGYNLNQLESIAHETLQTVERHSLDGVRPILDAVHDRHPAIRLEWVASDGSTIYDTTGGTARYDFGQLAGRFVNMPDNLWAEHETATLVYSLARNGQSEYLLLSLPSDEMKTGQVYFFSRSFKLLYALILPVLLSALVPYFLSIWFFSSINRRIGKLNKALGQVGLRSDVLVLEDKSKDEVGQLTRHYNEMARRIQQQAVQIEQFDKRRRLLLSNLSHDLRTPLTMILGYAETIRTNSFHDDGELRKSAKIILQRSRYMDKLLDQLLDISRQDSGAFEIHPTPTNLSELMRKIVSDYLLLLDGQNYAVDIEIPEKDVESDLDASLMERAVRNLLDNALRYGSDGEYLGIGLVQEDDCVLIIVKDRGRGIDPADRDRIFERFYRANEGRQGEGLGIGLSIVKEVVDLHQGHIRLTSTPYGETSFTLLLPQRRSQE